MLHLVPLVSIIRSLFTLFYVLTLKYILYDLNVVGVNFGIYLSRIRLRGSTL